MRVVETGENGITSNYKLIIEKRNKVVLSIPYDIVRDVNTGGRENRKGLWKPNLYIGSICKDEFDLDTDTNFMIGRLTDQSSSDYELYSYNNGTRPISLSFDYATTSYNENMSEYLLLWKIDGYIGTVREDTLEFHDSVGKKDITNRNIRT